MIKFWLAKEIAEVLFTLIVTVVLFLIAFILSSKRK